MKAQGVSWPNVGRGKVRTVSLLPVVFLVLSCTSGWSQVVFCAFLLNGDGKDNLKTLVDRKAPCRIGGVTVGPFALNGDLANGKIDPKDIKVEVVDGAPTFGLKFTYKKAVGNADLTGMITYPFAVIAAKKSLDNISIRLETLQDCTVTQTATVAVPSIVVSSITLKKNKTANFEYSTMATLKASP